MTDDDFGKVNHHYHQRHTYTVEGVPNVRPAVMQALYQLGRGIRCMEVGVADGTNARAMLDLLRPSSMILVDTNERCGELVFGYDCLHLIGKSQEVLKRLPPDSLDFAYIDADHDTDPVISDIRDCIQLVRVGGIIGGDDYDGGETPLREVAAAVRAVFENQFDVRNDGYDFWTTVTPEIKGLV